VSEQRTGRVRDIQERTSAEGTRVCSENRVVFVFENNRQESAASQSRKQPRRGRAENYAHD